MFTSAFEMKEAAFVLYDFLEQSVDINLMVLEVVLSKIGFIKINLNSNNLAFLNLIIIKSALSGLRQFLATENSLKLMKNAF